MSDAPKLYSAAVCPFAQRTRMVLHEKMVDLTYYPFFERYARYADGSADGATAREMRDR